MFRPIEIFIGLRYTVSRRRNHFISFISFASMLGIALGVAVLITVLSVMNGFEKELRERMLGVVSHVTVSQSREGLENWESISEQLMRYPNVKGAAPYIHKEGMLTRGSNVAGTVVRGIFPEKEPAVSSIHEKMIIGHISNLTAGDYGIILGSGLAHSLGVSVGDSVMLVSPQGNITAVGFLPRLKRFDVVGIFEIGMSDFDNTFALIHAKDAATLFRLNERVSGIRLRLDDMYAAPRLVKQLANDLPLGYQISDWTRQNANFFRAVKMEKTVMFVILLLIVAVAAFNLVSSLVMMVNDKKADIAILRTLGITPSGVMIVFIVQGAVIGTVGTLLGLFAGVSLAQNIETIVPAIERLLEVRFLSPDIYYIADLPSDMRWKDVSTISLLSFSFSLIATIYPAWRAARTQPAEALRYE